jgi:hypothetical protein
MINFKNYISFNVPVYTGFKFDLSGRGKKVGWGVEEYGADEDICA